MPSTLSSVIPQFNLTTWAGIAAAGALLGTFWRTVLTFIQRIGDLIICRVTVRDEAARALMSHVWQKGHRSPFGLRLFAGTTSYVFPKRRVEVVAYETITGEPLLFWIGRAPVLISLHYSGKGSAINVGTGGNSGSDQPITIRYFRGSINAEQFISEAVRRYNNIRQSVNASASPVAKRFNVVRMHGPDRSTASDRYLGTKLEDGGVPRGAEADKLCILTQLRHNEVRLLDWKAEDLIERPSDAPAFSNHPVSSDILSQLDEIDVWMKQEQWFRSRGVPWYRGILLHGPTGSGKSTIVRNIAMRYDLPIYSFDLSSYDNRSFTQDWQRVLQNVPAILLLEDLDCTFHGRENVAAKDKTRDHLTFDCLLNTLSGVGSSDGVLLFVTTNHIEKLDPALGVPVNGHGRSTRPGRINKTIFVGPMEEKERRKLAAIILSDWPQLIDQVVIEGEGEMAAQFQERCVRLAGEMFWGSKRSA